MELRTASATYRMVNYRFRTYDKLAAALRCTPTQASALALSREWSNHTDRTSRTRVSVPESFIISQNFITQRATEALG